MLLKNIAILRCLKRSASCDGGSCLKYFNNNLGDFSKYAGIEKQLVGMWTCNGCGASQLEDQEGLQRKMDRAKKQDLDMLYISGCVYQKKNDGSKELCLIIKDIAQALQNSGVKVFFGTDWKGILKFFP